MKIFHITAIILFFILLSSHFNLRAEEIIVGHFSNLVPTQDFPEQWEKLTFPKIKRHTNYMLIRDNNRTVVKAVSRNSASGLIRYYMGTAERLPWIAWQWKIEHVLEKGDVTRKKGDDYPARIYIAFEFSSKGKTFWQRLQYKTANLAAGGKLPGSALNYIWANKSSRGIIIDNPYTNQTKMIVLQSGNDLAGQWISEKRNIATDYQAAFGEKPPPIMGIAIMTDTDNTGESVTAFYGDIQLSEH